MIWRCSLLISIAMLFELPQAFCQREQGGFLVPGDSLEKILPKRKIIYLPEDGFSFYEAPSGEFKGKILPGPPLGTEQDVETDTLLVATLTGNQIQSQKLAPEFFFESTDSCFHISFMQQREGFLFVDNEQFQGWLPLDEVSAKGFKIISWMQFYGESKERNIHTREKTTAIRSAPSDNAPIIATADELYSEITSTGKCDGFYCFVKIIQYKNPYDPSKSKEENILKKYKGWIKIIDEEGKPLVAHNR